MTNLTKQEIQDAKYWIENAESNYDEPCEHIRDVLGKDVYNTILQALDIAEKYVWLPISEAPKDGTKILVCFPKGAIHVVRWGETHREDVSECWVFTDTTDSCSFEFEEPTHYMPLPTR